MDWQANNVRIVLFTTSPSTEQAGPAWVKLAGGRFPDAIQPNPPMGTVAAGDYEGLWLVVAPLPGRIQIEITGKPRQEGPPLPISDIRGAIDTLCSLVPKLEVAGINRLAVAVEAVRSVRNGMESVEALRAELPFLQLAPDAEDVIFQVNSPRRLKERGLKMNRLCKWQTLLQQLYYFEMAAGTPLIPGQAPGGAGKIVSETHQFGLSVDVNTHPTGEAISQKKVPAVLAELAESTLEVLHLGYAAL